MKRCADCGESKPPTEFHRNKAASDGLYAYCKVCSNRRAKAWAKANPDKVAKQVREWRAAHPGQYAETQRAWRAKNPGKSAEYTRRYREQNPEKTDAMRRAKHLRYKFDMTVEEYDALLASQGGVCLLCGAEPTEKKRLCVDHCHAQGHIRGLLCQRCNRTLGLFDDDPGWFRRAADYLERHSTPRT